MVKISVIIPVYNVEDYLSECLDSICSQSFEDIEIICVDDGSTDNSLNILKGYEINDKRVNVISQENKGIGAARNEGLRHATGDYIYFADSDDYLEDGALKEMIGIAEEKSLDLVMFKLINFNDKTGERDYNYSNMPFLKEKGIFTYKDLKDNLFKVDVTVYTKLFKRELLIGKRFEEGLIFEDNIFFISYIFDAKRIYFYDKCLYNRRIRDNSIISSSNEKHGDVIIAFNKIEDILREKGFYMEFKESLFISKINGCHYRYTQINPENKQDFFNKMKNDFTSKQNEYRRDLDFKEIDIYSKTLFENLLKSNSPEDFDLSMKKPRKNSADEKETLISKLKKWSPF